MIEELIRYILKSLFYVYSCLRADLEIRQAGVIDFSLDGLCIHFSLVFEIAFITQNHSDSFLLLAVEAQIDPFIEIIEGALVSIRDGVLVISKTMKATEASLR